MIRKYRAKTNLFSRRLSTPDIPFIYPPGAIAEIDVGYDDPSIQCTESQVEMLLERGYIAEVTAEEIAKWEADQALLAAAKAALAEGVDHSVHSESEVQASLESSGQAFAADPMNGIDTEADVLMQSIPTPPDATPEDNLNEVQTETLAKVAADPRKSKRKGGDVAPSSDSHADPFESYP